MWPLTVLRALREWRGLAVLLRAAHQRGDTEEREEEVQDEEAPKHAARPLYDGTRDWSKAHFLRVEAVKLFARAERGKIERGSRLVDSDERVQACGRRRRMSAQAACSHWNLACRFADARLSPQAGWPSCSPTPEHARRPGPYCWIGARRRVGLRVA